MPAVLTFAPIRGATEDEQQCYEALEFQSTRPLQGATSANGKKLAELMVFQSTRPLRGATLKARKAYAGRAISIHVPRTGHDKAAFADISPKTANFNPRAPYGARLCGYHS